MCVSIIIPMFNEENNILKLLEEIKLILSKTDDKFNDYEIIIIDDKSSDSSFNKVNQYLKTDKKITLLKNDHNLGQSFSITKGIKISKYETIITIDADGQNNPKDIKKMIEVYFQSVNLELLAGIRKYRKDNIIKIISSRTANKIRSYILKDGCKDTGCSLKIFNKKTYLSFPYFNGIHRFIPALFVGYGKKIAFIDVDHRPRLFGQSKYGTFTRLYKGIFDLIRVIRIIRNIKND